MRPALLASFIALAASLSFQDAAAQSGPVSIALGSGFGCGLDADGSVRCWGSSRNGECGVVARGVATTRIEGISGAEEVDAGFSYACARSGGEVRCWGHNNRGQLGAGAEGNGPHLVPGLPPVAELALGNFNACVRGEDGSVWCWGVGDRGQLGPAVAEQSATPVRIPRVRRATRLFAGHNHFCALDARGRLTCWGNNSGGQTGARRARRSPPRVVRRTGPIRDVALGDSFSCVLNDDGRIRCWGQDLPNIGDAANATRPTRHPAVEGATAIALAGENLCIIVGGRPMCWGVNRRRELHVPTPEMGGIVLVPTAVPGVTGVSRIVMRDRVQCVAAESGPWRCWGWNRGGENRVGAGLRDNDVTSPMPLQW